MWTYNSPAGLMRIYIHEQKFVLEIDGEIYGFYQSAVAAADDVYTYSTGCAEWDLYEYDEVVDIPTDIHEWNKC